MNINKNELSIEQTELSRNYNYCKIAYAGNMFDNIQLRGANVCILPFETESTGKAIDALYLYKYYDFVKDKSRVSTLLYRNNEEKDETNLDTVIRCIGDTMQIPLTEEDIKRIFYVGEIELNNLMSGAIPCYAVNVTGLTNNHPGTYSVNDQLDITLEKFPYSTVLRGTSQDYLVAASTFMLLSYLS